MVRGVKRVPRGRQGVIGFRDLRMARWAREAFADTVRGDAALHAGPDQAPGCRGWRQRGGNRCAPARRARCSTWYQRYRFSRESRWRFPASGVCGTIDCASADLAGDGPGLGDGLLKRQRSSRLAKGV